MLLPDKALVRQRFRKSLSSYFDNAHVQREMADLMTNEVASFGLSFNRILEIGCGAGLLTGMVEKRFSCERYYLNDIVEECSFLADREPRREFIPGDIEGVERLPGGLDLVISNATVQWLVDLPRMVERLSTKMVPGATLALSTFGPGNTCEISTILGISLDYPTREEFTSAISKHFEIKKVHEFTRTLSFSTPLEVLRHLKLTGATALSQKLWTRGTLGNFCEEYKKLFSVNGGDEVKLTYQPLVVVAKKVGGR